MARRGNPRELQAYRAELRLTQAQLAETLGVTQAYVSQLECGARRVSARLATRLAALPKLHHLPPTVFPEESATLDSVNLDLAADLAAVGYPGFAQQSARPPKNPAALIVSILRPDQVAPAVMAAVPWLLLRYPGINVRWLVDQARLNNLQNRLGFLTDLACEIARARAAAGRFDEVHLAKLDALLMQLDESRLAKTGTLARVLTPAERQFFEDHRSDRARHWNLLTGLTIAQLTYR
jgi:transcriptional regulator with XRE-family HTH domain